MHDDDLMGWRARIGLIVPDALIPTEPWFYRVAPRGVIFLTTRMSLGKKTTPDTLKKMAEHTLRGAKELANAEVDLISFCCTSGSFIEGPGYDQKIIKEIGLSSRRDCIGFRLITKSVERTADHAVRIAENILKLKKPVEKKLYTLIEDMCLSAISLFNLSVETLFREDFQHANETVMNAKKVASMRTNLMEHIFKKTDIEEVSSLGLIIDSIIRTAEYSSDIAEIVLNLNIDKIILSSLD